MAKRARESRGRAAGRTQSRRPPPAKRAPRTASASAGTSRSPAAKKLRPSVPSSPLSTSSSDPDVASEPRTLSDEDEADAELHSSDDGSSAPDSVQLAGQKRKRGAKAVAQGAWRGKGSKTQPASSSPLTSVAGSDPLTDDETADRCDRELTGALDSLSAVDFDLIDPSDDHLINEASFAHLHRIKRDELIRLSRVAGLLESEEETSLKKGDLADALIAARSARTHVQPFFDSSAGSSRNNSAQTSARTSSRSSELSDDEDEPSDYGTTPRRRSAAQPVVLRGRGPPLAHVVRTRSREEDPGNDAEGEETEWEAEQPGESSRIGGRGPLKRTTSGSSVASTGSGIVEQGMRAMRMRSRSLGGSISGLSSIVPSAPGSPEASSSRASSRRHTLAPSSATNHSPPAKARQRSTTSAKPRRRGSGSRPTPEKKSRMHVAFGERAKMADVVEEEEERGVGGSRRSSRPHPVALVLSRKGKEREVVSRPTPGRKAKNAALEALRLAESDEEDASSDDPDATMMAVDENGTPMKRPRRPPTRASHPILTPLSAEAAPTRRRSARPDAVTQIPTPPSDGDDDDSQGEVIEGDEIEDEAGDGDEAGEEGTAAERKRSRSTGRLGLRKIEPKILSESTDEEDATGGDEMQSVHENDDDDAATVLGVDEEEDTDLTEATKETLVRLRRDDLVRLCFSREIDVSGTKPQLAEALLQWRDSSADNDGGRSSPVSHSSGHTARPGSSTSRHATRRRPHAGDPAFDISAPVTPTLLQGDHVHQVPSPQAATPPPSGHAHQGAGETELSLDLESLGLVDREIPVEQIQKMEKVGSGGFKDVYVGKLRNRTKIAIAEFRGQLSEMDIKELKLLADFNHPNVVKFIGVAIPEDKRTPIMMISELCENGDLFDYIRNVPAPSLKVVVKLMLDIARGLSYLHNLKPAVIHRDVKSSNILINSRVVAKVGDFGLARVKHSTRSMIRSLVGTVCYQPPEMWTAHPKYDSTVDVFSCAMVFWEMLQWHKPEKKFPWEGMNEHAIYDVVGAKKQRPSTHRLRSQWGSDVVDLMEHMWSQEPKDRPSMDEVVDTLAILHRTL